MSDGSRKFKTFEWTPSPFIENISGRDFCPVAKVDDNKIRKISFADITSFFYAEAICHSMAHFFSNFFQADLSLFIIMEHQQQGMLDKRQACMSFFVRA